MDGGAQGSVANGGIIAKARDDHRAPGQWHLLQDTRAQRGEEGVAWLARSPGCARVRKCTAALVLIELQLGDNTRFRSTLDGPRDFLLRRDFERTKIVFFAALVSLYH